VELVTRTTIVGEEQEPDSDLGDEQRLREREEMRRDCPGTAAAPVEHAAEERRESAYRDRDRPEPRMEPRHAARVAEQHPGMEPA